MPKLIFIIFSFAALRAKGSGSWNNEADKVATFDESTFSFYPVTTYYQNADDADSKCQKYGGFLAHVKTEEVSNFIIREIEDYKLGGDDSPYNDMFLIGLYQVGEDTNEWQWSDGTPLNFNNWYKPDDVENYNGEPNSPGETCAAIGTKDVGYKGSATAIFGYWCDKRCQNSFKLICENRYGSGFVSESTIDFKTANTVTCTVVGDSHFTAIWSRKGSPVSNSSVDPIFQTLEIFNSEGYMISTIHFVNPLVEDEGEYVCESLKDETYLREVATVVLKNTQFQDPVVVTPEVHKISETREVRCSCFGRPIPTLDWSYANTALEENHEIFSVNTLQDSITQTATSVFQIVNPISFDHDFGLMCTTDLSGSNTGIIKINNDFEDFDGSSYKVGLYDSGYDKELCELIKGNIEEDEVSGAKYCRLVAAEMEENIESDETICRGSELVVFVKDFTETNGNYSLGVSPSSQQIEGQLSREGTVSKISGLQPRTSYNVELNFVPTYWMQEVSLTRTYTTKGVKPDEMLIENAKIDQEGKCVVNFNETFDNATAQITKIQINVQTIRDGSLTSSSTIQTFYANPFHFVANDLASTYNFTAQFVACSGEVGLESVQVQCKTEDLNTGLSGGIIAAIVCSVLLFIILGALLLIYRKRKSNPKEESNHFPNKAPFRAGKVNESLTPDIQLEARATVKDEEHYYMDIDLKTPEAGQQFSDHQKAQTKFQHKNLQGQSYVNIDVKC